MITRTNSILALFTYVSSDEMHPTAYLFNPLIKTIAKTKIDLPFVIDAKRSFS